MGVGAWRRRAAIRRALRGRSVLRVAGFLLVFVLTAAALSRSIPAWLGEVAFAAAVQAVALGAVALGTLATPADAARRWAERVVGPEEGSPARVGEAAPAPGASSPPRIDRFALLAAGWTLAVTLLLAVTAYERHPHVPDEVGYLLHAAYLADGRLTMEAPPVPEGFDVDLMDVEGDRWWSPVPPGWPAVLAIGSRLGAPWAVNPVLAAIGVLFGYLLAWRIYDRPTARIVGLLLATSPWSLFLGMSFMGHSLTAALALGGALAVGRSHVRASVGWAAVAGALVGLVSLVRPLDGLALGLVLGARVTFELRPWRIRWGCGLVFGLAGALVAGVQGVYNAAITGSAGEFPLMRHFERLYDPGANALGFGADRGFGWTGLDPRPGHDLLDVAINAALNGHALNVELFGWACGSLLLLAGFLAFARLDRRDLGLVAAALVVVGVYALYWFSGGPDFGPRYWFLLLFPCVALTARGARRLAAAWDARALVGVGAMVVSAALVFLPWRAIDKYHEYRGMRPDVRELAAERGFGRGLVLIRGDRHPDYASAAVYLPVDLRADAPVYAWDRDPSVRRRLLEAFPDRPVWIVDGPTVTGDGYRVVEGPTAAEAAGRR